MSDDRPAVPDLMAALERSLLAARCAQAARAVERNWSHSDAGRRCQVFDADGVRCALGEWHPNVHFFVPAVGAATPSTGGNGAAERPPSRSRE